MGIWYNSVGFMLLMEIFRIMAVIKYGTYADGDIIRYALDMDNGKVYFAKNGTWINHIIQQLVLIL